LTSGPENPYAGIGRVPSFLRASHVEPRTKRMKSIRTLRFLILALMLAVLSASAPALALTTVPQTITNQGRLFDADQDPINGTLEVVFAVYDSANAAVPIWSEQQSVTFDEGFYSVSLGSVVPFGTTVFDGSLRFFGITIGNSPELSPRAPIQSVP